MLATLCMQPALTRGFGGEQPLRSLLDDLSHGLLLVRDGLDADGAFTLPLLAAAALAAGDAVLLVAVGHSPTRHRTALRKAGAQLGSCKLEIIAPAPLPDLGGAGAGSCAAALLRARRLHGDVLAAAHRLLGHAGGAEQQQQEQQQQSPSSLPLRLTVLLDSLPALRVLVGGAAASDALLANLCGLSGQLRRSGGGGSSNISSSGGSVDSSSTRTALRLVVRGARDVAADYAALGALHHVAAAVVDVLPLPPGRPAGLDGRLEVVWLRSCPPTSSCGSRGSSASWFFRMGDGGVAWLAELAPDQVMAAG
jgi:hypothetical protein